MKRKQSPAMIAVAVVCVLAYAMAGYFFVVSPQRGKSTEIQKETAAVEAQIVQYRALERASVTATPIRVAELFRLTKAMPDDVDMAGLILELSRVARESGIDFDSITPQGAASIAGYSSVPISLVFDGNYYQLSDFLFRLRSLVRVHSGRLFAEGRVFVVDSLSFSESERAFPRIKAALVVHAFTFGDEAGARAAGLPPPASTETTSTDTTETTPTTAPATTQQSPDVPPGAPSGASTAGEAAP